MNSTEKLVTALAYPALTKFQDSTEVSLKIERLTPFWLGVGLSLGKKKYEPQSKDHILLTSNGWVSILGEMQRTPVKYGPKDTVRVKLDKGLGLVEFSANNERHTIPLQLQWSQDVHLCCVLFYKGDSVLLLA